MKVRLRIDGTDRSSLLPRTGWTLEDSEGKRISTLTLPLEDRTGAVAASALELKEVILDDPDAPSTRWFLGLVTQVDTRPLEGVGLKHDIVCQEYGWLLEHYFYTARWADTNDSTIISDAFTGTGLTEIDATTNVITGRLIEKFVMNNMSLRDMMDALANITGYIWYVDWTKKLVYQSPFTSFSSYTLTDAPSAVSDLRYRNLARTKDYLGMVTKVKIRGGVSVGASHTVPYAGDGTNKNFPTPGISTGPSDSQGLPDVERNDGSDGSPNWTVLTVGDAASGEAMGANDCLFNWTDSSIEFAVAPPNLLSSFRLTGRPREAFAWEREEAAALAEAGRTLEMMINDTEILTQQQAHDRAEAIFREKARAREKITLISNEDSFRSGQLVTLVNAKMGINKSYSIRRVVTRFLGGTLASHELTLTNPAKLNPDVVDMIAAGWKAAHPVIPERDSEMLVVFLSYTETAMSLADSTWEAFESSKSYRCMANPVSDWRMDEGQGATLEDWLGVNHLTLTGTPAWVQGKRSSAHDFDGATYGKKTTASSLPTTAITVMGWIKITTLANWRVIAAHDKDSDGGWNINVDSGGNLNFTILDGVSYVTASKSGISAGTWYHIAVTYDGANLIAYVDGVAGSSHALVGKTLDSAGDLYVGADNTLDNYMLGQIDELLMFNTALSATEIQRHRDHKYIRAGFWKCAA